MYLHNSFVLSLASSVHSQYYGTVIYKYKFNGAEMTDRSPTILTFINSKVDIRNLLNSNPNSEEFQTLNYDLKLSYQTACLKSGECFYTVDSFVNYNKPVLTDEYDSILGFKCRKATTVIRSNTFEIWFTDQTEPKGTPLINVGPELGLVLKIIRNGNFEIYADSIALMRETQGRYISGDPQLGELVDLPTYRQKLTEANFTTVRIFDNEK